MTDMMRQRLIIAIVGALLCLPGMAQKPKWVDNTPKELNSTYQFIEIKSAGKSLAAARIDAKQQLAMNEQLQNAIKVSIESGLISRMNESEHNGKATSDYEEDVEIKVKTTGETYKLQAKVVDEYNAGHKGGLIQLHTLYMVAVADHPVFDRTYLSTSYGAAPVLMSLIPGVGQMYKGSYVKGGLMLAGVAACGIGALLFENQRSDYKNKMKEQPQFAKDYNTKANNNETARNICLGAAAAIYVYNLIDAAAAKGARRLTVKRADGSGLSLRPAATLDGAGVALTYNF